MDQGFKLKLIHSAWQEQHTLSSYLGEQPRRSNLYLITSLNNHPSPFPPIYLMKSQRWSRCDDVNNLLLIKRRHWSQCENNSSNKWPHYISACHFHLKRGENYSCVFVDTDHCWLPRTFLVISHLHWVSECGLIDINLWNYSIRNKRSMRFSCVSESITIVFCLPGSVNRIESRNAHYFAVKIC